MNFARRDKCRKCRKRKDFPKSSKVGDCNAMNFGTRTVCYKYDESIGANNRICCNQKAGSITCNRMQRGYSLLFKFVKIEIIFFIITKCLTLKRIKYAPSAPKH